jgi:hypothetical protein
MTNLELAANSNTPLETLIELSLDDSEEVRNCASENPKLMEWILQQKISFILTLWNDTETEKKLPFLSKLETMFDHSKNDLPEDWNLFTKNIPYNSKLKITLEFVNE